MPLQFTPIQNDVAEANAKLAELYTAYNALEAKYASQPAPVPSPAPTTVSRIITLAEKEIGFEFRTEDFGKTFEDGGKISSYDYAGQSSHPNNAIESGATALRSSRMDKPFRVWSYNMNADKTRKNGNEHASGHWYEPFWFNPTLGWWTDEEHLMDFFDRRGLEHRIITRNTRLDNGNTLLMMEAGSISVYAKHQNDYAAGFKRNPYWVVNSAGQQFLEDVEGNNASQVIKNGKSGLKSVWTIAGDVPQFDLPATPSNNPSIAAKGFHYDGNGPGHLKPFGTGFRVYNSMQEAKNYGQEVGDQIPLRWNGLIISVIVE